MNHGVPEYTQKGTTVNINQFHQPKADAFKFENVGDDADGVIAQEPELTTDKFNADRPMMVVRLSTDNGVRALFARNQMLDAIGEAVTAAGVEEIAEGGALRVVYVEDRVLRNGRTMKVYKADYAPPPPMGIAELGETGDVWNLPNPS